MSLLKADVLSVLPPHIRVITINHVFVTKNKAGITEASKVKQKMRYKRNVTRVVISHFFPALVIVIVLFTSCDLPIHCHSVSVQSVCLPNIVYKIHCGVGFVL